MPSDQHEGAIGRLKKRIRTWRRRRWLKMGYSKIAQARLDKTYGFTPTMYRQQLMEEEGYIETTEDGEMRWLWP